MPGHRARSSRRTTPSFPPLTTSADALGLASALARRFDFLHAAVVLDRRHRVCDLTPFTDRAHHTVSTAIEWAWCMFSTHDRASKLVLISIDRAVVGHPPCEADELVSLQSSFADDGIDVLDWIWHDRNGVHTLAYAVDAAGAWPDDPPELRAEIAWLLHEADAPATDTGPADPPAGEAPAVVPRPADA